MREGITAGMWRGDHGGAWWEDEGAWRDEGMREQGEERTSEGGDEEGGEEVHLCWVPYCHPRAAAWLHPLSFLTYSPWRSRLCRALLVSSAFPMAAPPSSPMSQPAPHSIINHRPSHAQSPLWFTISTYCPSSFSMHHSTPPLLPQPHALCSALASATLHISARASLTTLSATLMHLVACPVVLPCICHGVRHLVHLCWVPYCHPRAATWLHPPSFLPFSLLQ